MTPIGVEVSMTVDLYNPDMSSPHFGGDIFRVSGGSRIFERGRVLSAVGTRIEAPRRVGSEQIFFYILS